MENIIQEIIEKCTKNFEKDLKNIEITEIVKEVKEITKEIGKEMVIKIIEEIDKAILKSKKRKKEWHKERKDNRTILTELGEISYVRTYYKSKDKEKKGRRYSYLTDEVIGVEGYQKIDNGVTARILELASEYSYEESGNIAIPEIKISKQTVMKKVMKFLGLKIKEEEYKKKNKKVLFIDADEDHITLQDGKKKINKLVYVYEGKVEESKGKNRLMNVKYFGGVEIKSEDLWIEVSNYINKRYAEEYLEKVFIMGDGANWIKGGAEWVEKSEYIIDDFHLSKAINKIAGKDEVRKEKKKKAAGYIRNKWKGIETRNKYKEKYKLGCSAEGHVSNILASKMSSRPKAWSIKGIDSKTKLRLFMLNGGNIEKIKEVLKANKKLEKIEYMDKINCIKTNKKVQEVINNIPVIVNGLRNNLFKTLKTLSKGATMPNC